MSEAAERQTVDWGKFVVRIYLKAAPEEIYTAWATEAGLARWFLAIAKFRPNGRWRDVDEPAVKGDAIEWTWVGNKNFVMKGSVLGAESPGRFAFTFGRSARVTVAIKPDRDRTLVQLTQSHMPDTPESRRDYVDCHSWWTFYLTNLKSVLEGGRDLRERDPEVLEVINR